MTNNRIRNFAKLKLNTNKILFGFICSSILCTGCSQSLTLNPSIANILEPKMVTIPSGSFQMGSNCCERNDEEPVHLVTIKTFRMSQTEVTFAQWDACISDGACTYRPNDQGWGRGNRPVIDVSYQHITEQFIPWLNKIIGQTFRLPTEAEWEYAAQAGSSTKYSWGNNIDCSQAQYGRYGLKEANKLVRECGESYHGTVKVKSFLPNSFGLYDMNGNAWELVEDCYHESYNGAPSDGTAWLSGDCTFDRVLRGGGWFTPAVYLRSADRNGIPATQHDPHVGFRLAQDLSD